MTTSIRLRPRRSAFSAAFLSFIFPGLGQAYAGSRVRALAFAVPGILGILAAAGLFLSMGLVNFGLWLADSDVLGPLVVVNLILLAYRAIASVDAYRQALEKLPPAIGRGPARRIGFMPGDLHPLSVVGLVAILVTMIGGHVIVGFWDLKLYNLELDTHSIVVIPTDAPSDSASPEPTPISFPPLATLAPAATIQPWTGTGRLNILLCGADQTAAFRTDTMMVVSIDPKTHQVAMFSIPRDTEGLPLPPKSRLSQLWGPNFPYKLNGLWKASDKYRQLFPNGGVDALKQALGYTFFGNQSAIQYYALVNFDGFKKVIDTFGGVTIDVGSPVIDDGYPGNGGNGHGKHYRVYIPAGIQHMNGDQALTYARTRHNVGGNDYARAARQQQVLVSLEQQANIDAISSHLSDLVDALGSTVHTDIPQGPEVLGPLVQMAKSIKMDDIKQYVFSPPIYMSAGYTPNIPAIRAAVKAAISGGAAAPDQLQAAIAEDAPIIVENGSGVSGQDSTVAAYLQALGLNGETSPTQPSATAKTTLICVNGAETKYPATLAELELLLGISGTPSADPSSVIQTATEPSEEPGFVLITANASPWVTSPPSS